MPMQLRDVVSYSLVDGAAEPAARLASSAPPCLVFPICNMLLWQSDDYACFPVFTVVFITTP